MSTSIRRRDFVRQVAGLGALVVLSGCDVRPSTETRALKVARIGILQTSDARFVDAVREGLRTGSNFPSQARMGAELVDQILRGARPAELPVALSTGSDFILNLTAAQRIGLTIPESVRRQVTEFVR